MDNKYGELVVRFRPEIKEPDFHLHGARIENDDGIFIIVGENGAGFIIPRDAVVFIGYASGGAKINAVEDHSNPSRFQVVYNLRRDEDDS